MSQENVEIVRKVYAALNRHDVDNMLRFVGPGIELHLPEGGINAGPVRGHQAVREFATSYFEAFESFQITPQRILDEGDRIVADCRVSALGRSSGVAVEDLPTHIWTLRAGMAVRLDVFPERKKPNP